MANDLGLVHRWVEPRRPGAETLLLLHGTGGNENDLIPVGWELAPGAGLLSPRGAVLERGMPRFFRRLAEGVFDLDDLRARTDQLAEFVSRAAQQYGFDPTRVTAVGYSNGANIAASLLLLRPGILHGAVLFRPMVPLEPDPLPRLNDVSVLISAGREDPIVSPSESERLGALLERAGAAVEMRWQEGGHALTSADLKAASAWLGRSIAIPDSY